MKYDPLETDRRLNPVAHDEFLLYPKHRKSPVLLPAGDESIEAAYRFELYKMTNRTNEKLSVVAYGLRAAKDNHNHDIRDLGVLSDGTYSFDSIMNKCEWVNYDDGYPLPKKKEDWTTTSFIKDMMLNVLPHPGEDAALLRVYCKGDVFGWDEREYTKRYVECIWCITQTAESWDAYYPEAAVGYTPRWAQFITYNSYRVLSPRRHITALQSYRLVPAIVDLTTFLEESDDDSLLD